MLHRFTHQSALVTGGTSGIGLAIAEALAAEGAQVVAAGLNADGTPRESIRFVELDVTDALAAEQLVNRFDDLHCLVNAAGIIARQDEFDATRFTDVLEVNLIAVQRLSTLCYPKLKSGGGSILNIGSLYSHLGAPHSPGYAASKGGVVQLTKSLAAAWAVDGIRVNALAPGWIETAFTEPLRNDPERNAAVLGRTPLGRWGQPAEVARTALFLLSSEASYITGTVLPVDGGYLCQ